MTAKIPVSAVLHELQSHITTISLYCSELAPLIEGGLNARVRKVQRVADHVQRVLDALQVLEADHPVIRTRVDLSAVATSIAMSQRERNSAYAATQVRIQSSMRIHASLAEVEMVLDNLIGNALKFSASSPSPQVCVSSSNEGEHTLIHVSDNGVGIAPEDSERIFELFTRVHSGFDGSGVGLAIAKRIVERHGGRIWATGESGAGMTMSFYV